MHCILWFLFYKLCFCRFFFAYEDISCMHCNQSILFYKYHFIHPLSQLNYLSSHSIHFILYISFSIFQIINFNSMHVIISTFIFISFFASFVYASLSMHLSLCTRSMRYLFIFIFICLYEFYNQRCWSYAFIFYRLKDKIRLNLELLDLQIFSQFCEDNNLDSSSAVGSPSLTRYG